VSIPYVSGDELRERVPIERAISALEEAFVADDIDAPQRTRHATAGGDLLVMPAWGREHVGIKLVTVSPTNSERDLPLIHGTYTLFDAATMVPSASIDAEELTRIRTAAVSAVATKRLAGEEAHRLVVFGAGAQAHGHVEAMRAVRPIEHVTIVTRSEDSATRMARRVSDDFDLPAEPGAPEAVRDADIVCTCTTSSTPVFDGDALKERVHINAVGSYRPEARELDDTTMRRAETVVVEKREVAFAEAGDVVLALGKGVLSRGRVIELKDLLNRSAEPHGVTVFKSVGVALEDLVVASLAAPGVV
jgi:ornithine cyclodeaminase/alanine dehydrogenase-like protein (mu-crystallin family)